MMARSKNEFTVVGEFASIDVFTTNSGKDIVTLILDVDKDSKWPQKVPVKCFGKLADDVRSYRPGTVLEVTGSLGGREVKGRVWGDIKAQTVEVVSEPSRQGELLGAKRAKKGGEEDDGTDLPF